MPKLAIIATIEVAPGRRDQLLPLLMAHRSRCLKDEPGITLQFDVLLPHDDDTKVLSYEVYRDAAAFDAHRNGPSIAQFREETARMGVKLSVRNPGIVDLTCISDAFGLTGASGRRRVSRAGPVRADAPRAKEGQSETVAMTPSHERVRQTLFFRHEQFDQVRDADRIGHNYAGALVP